LRKLEDFKEPSITNDGKNSKYQNCTKSSTPSDDGVHIVFPGLSSLRVSLKKHGGSGVDTMKMKLEKQ